MRNLSLKSGRKATSITDIHFLAFMTYKAVFYLYIKGRWPTLNSVLPSPLYHPASPQKKLKVRENMDVENSPKCHFYTVGNMHLPFFFSIFCGKILNWTNWVNDKCNTSLCESLWLIFSYVLIAMEALDQLLMACHSQSIKPFVESFLHMVAKLLESGEPKLQVLGTNSVSKLRC